MLNDDKIAPRPEWSSFFVTERSWYWQKKRERRAEIWRPKNIKYALVFVLLLF